MSALPTLLKVVSLVGAALDFAKRFSPRRATREELDAKTRRERLEKVRAKADAARKP